MAQNFIACDRGQSFLLPPSLTDWLAEDHLVWTVLGAVDQMDLDGFYGAYRANGQGRAAYDPQMMVALLLYAYCVGIRSSRMIERSCRGDVAFRVITAMAVPDHSTVAEFRRRHEDAIAGLFVEVLSLCNEAGLVSFGGDQRGRDEAACQCRPMTATGGMSRLWRRSSVRPSRPTAPRMSSTAPRGGMRSRRRCAHGRSRPRSPAGRPGADADRT